jgi:hypothetical protein
VEYNRASESGERIYAYLLERYGQWALEQASEWETLAGLRASILAAGHPDGDDLTKIEQYYGQLMPLMTQLSGLRIPDEVVFVQHALRNDQEEPPGRSEPTPPDESKSGPPPG